MFRSSLILSLLSVVAIASTSTAAEAPKIFVATSDNDISLVSFSDGSVTPVVSLGGQNFEDVVLREEGGLEILAASTTNGGNIHVFDGTTGALKASIPFAGASGLSLSPDGDVFATNASPGDADRVIVVPRIPGGFGVPVAIDAEVRVGGVPTTELADVEFVAFGSSALFAGDILVLVKRPAMLLRYCSGHIFDVLGREHKPEGGCEAEEPDVIVGTAAFDGAEPTGVTFAPDGTLLVVAGNEVLNFDVDGTPLGAFSTLPADGERIDASVPSTPGDPGLVVVGIRSGAVVQFGFPTAGAGSVISSGISATGGVAIQSGNAVFTPGGPNSTVILQSLTATFEDAGDGGFTSSNCIAFVDPRGASCPDSGPVRLDDDCMPDDVEALVEGAALVPELPEYIQGFVSDPGGEETLRICAVDTGVEFQGLIDTDSNEIPWLGYKPHCDDADATMRPRFFYAEDVTPALFEGSDAFINLTTVCNRDGAETWRWKSIFITGAREMRSSVGDEPVASADCSSPSGGILNCQLRSLDGVLDVFASGVAGKSKERQAASLASKLASVIRRFDRAQYCRAKADLVSFEGLVAQADANALFPEEEIAELRSRTKAALFTFRLPEVCPDP